MNKYEILPSSSFGFICRTCLLHNELFPIDEVSWEGISLKGIILDWTSLEVEEDERLPRQMCSKCIKLMYQTYHFLSKCKSSEWTLKSILLSDKLVDRNEWQDGTKLTFSNETVVNVDPYYTSEIKLDRTTDQSNSCSDNDNSTQDIDNINHIIPYSDVDDSLPDSENIDASIPEYLTIDDLTKIKTEISSDEEILAEDNSNEEEILHEIESIKTDISKIRAQNKIRIRQEMKERHFKNTKILKRKVPPYTCRYCEALYKTEEELKTHQNETHKKFYKFTCEYCQSKFQHVAHLEAHVRIHTGEKPYECPTCGNCFTFESVLKRHMVRHMEVKPHQCRYCDREFTRKDILEGHERKHIGKRLLCSCCGIECNSPKALARHEARSHPAIQNIPTSITENGYKCDVCGKVLQSEKTLQDHVLLHGPRNFKCNICKKGFTSSARLQLHLKMTHEGALFPCHLCTNVYKQKSGLIGHLESHHEQMEYICEECGKRFVYKGSLRQHMRLHTGDTTYQCKECDLVCVNRRRLEAHMRTHTGQKQFSCEICGEGYAQEANLLNHLKIHSKPKEKSYACNVCEKVFTDFKSLKEHIKNHIC